MASPRTDKVDGLSGATVNSKVVQIASDSPETEELDEGVQPNAGRVPAAFRLSTTQPTRLRSMRLTARSERSRQALPSVDEFVTAVLQPPAKEPVLNEVADP